MPQFLGCFVKCFHCVCSKSMSACQKSEGGGASIAVPTWWAVSVTKVSVGIAIGWRVVGNAKIMASSKSRSIRRAVVYGIPVISIRRKFHRCQSWLVNQREKECLGIISILAAVTCWGNKKWKRKIRCTDFVKSSNLNRQKKILILLEVIIIVRSLSAKYRPDRYRRDKSVKFGTELP